MRSVGRKPVALFLTLACLLTGTVGPFIGVSQPTTVQAKQQHTSKKETKEKIIGKTETATIYDMGNGKKKAEIYSEKVRYKEKNGEYTDYDTTLKKVKKQTTDAGTDLSEYAYQTGQSGQPAYFPQELSKKTPVITENGTYQVQIIPQTPEQKTEKSAIKPKREKTTDLYEQTEQKITSVQYENVLEKATLQYEAETNGLKESILLDDASAGSEYHFLLCLKNCIIVTQEALTGTKVTEKNVFATENGEALYLYDTKKDKLVGGIPAAFMVDASGDYSDACTYEIQRKKTQKGKNETIYHYDMTLRADEAYLRAPERSYPVTIDPTISWNECSSSAYVCRTAPNANYTDQNTNILCVGKREAAGDVCRSYIKFEGINTLLKNKTVTGVRLSLKTYGATANGMTVYARRVTSDWNPKSVTYNSQPSKANGTMGSFTTTSSSQRITLNLPASEINSAVAGGSWHGIELTDSSGDTNTTSANRVWIYNSVYINDDKIPTLEVVYTDKTTLDLPELAYNVYGKSSGWSDYVFDGETAGELSTGNPLQGFSMELNAGDFSLDHIKYDGFFQGIGWTNWESESHAVKAGKDNKNLKAIRMMTCNANGSESDTYSIYYRVYVKNHGWLGWAKNGEEAGDFTSSGEILGIQAMIVPILRFSQKHIKDGTTNSKYSENYDDKYSLPVGNGGKICGIGAGYDSKLQSYHTMNITIYKSSGRSISQNLLSTIYNEVGSDTTEGITGFRMQFNDSVMSSQYDIEHMGTAAGYTEETWRKNSILTGATSGSKVLEMMSARIVPRGYKEGKKKCISNGFVGSVDGFSFANGKDQFSFPNNYKTPLDKYYHMFSDELQAKQIYNSQNDKRWGLCYGMALASQLFSCGVWHIDKFKGNIDAAAESANGLTLQRLKKSKALTNLIEYAQISQYYNVYGKTYSETYNNMAALANKLENNPEHRYILLMNGHTVVPTGIKKSQNGYYHIYIYDVNYPGEVRIASCNINTNTFTYSNYTEAGLVDVNELITLNEEAYKKMEAMALR